MLKITSCKIQNILPGTSCRVVLSPDRQNQLMFFIYWSHEKCHLHTLNSFTVTAHPGLDWFSFWLITKLSYGVFSAAQKSVHPQTNSYWTRDHQCCCCTAVSFVKRGKSRDLWPGAIKYDTTWLSSHRGHTMSPQSLPKFDWFYMEWTWNTSGLFLLWSWAL